MNNFILSVLCFVFLFGLVGIFFIFQATAESVYPVSITNNTDKSHRVQLIAAENDLYLVWEDDTESQGDIFFSKNINLGNEFYSPINLSDNPGVSAFPRFAIINQTIYVTWYDYTPGLSDIFLAKSTDGGATFKTTNLSKNAGVSYNPWVATSGNNVYVVWNDDTDFSNIQRASANQNITAFDVSFAPFKILIAASHDGANSFEISNLSNTLKNSVDPRIAVFENYVYVIWGDRKTTYDIFLAASKDFGTTFSTPINVSRSDHNSVNSGIQALGENVHVIWREKTPKSTYIYYSKSNDGGISFNDHINLSRQSNDPRITRDTQMALSGDNVYVVWYENIPGSSGVFFVRSTDGGTTFSEPINLSGDSDKVDFAQIAVDEKKVFVIWNDYRLGNTEVFLRQSDDEGGTFGSIKNLSSDNNPSDLFILGPQIAVGEGNFFVAYEKEFSVGSNIVIKGFSADMNSENGTLLLKSVNESVNVEMGIGEENLEPDTPITFTLKFTNPSTGELLENVNYSFKILDVEGNTVLSRSNQFTKDGLDEQTVTFAKTEPFTITIDVEGLGEEPPYNTKYAGTASAVITVVPEFPLGFVGVMVLAMVAMIILRKFKGFQSLQKNSMLTN